MDEQLREKAQTIASLMAQMANENRLLILCALLDGPKTVGELGENVPNITAPALSQHLHKLKDGELVVRPERAFIDPSAFSCSCGCSGDCSSGCASECASDGCSSGCCQGGGNPQ